MKSELLVDPRGRPLEIPEKAEEPHLIEFFAYETRAMSLAMALEMGLVVRDEEGNYWGPEGTSIGPASTTPTQA